MSRSDCLKEKHEKGDWLSVDNNDEESAARTRPFSFEQIMLRRRNKELLENVKESVKEAQNISPAGSSENIADLFESGSIYKHDKSSYSGIEKHALEEPVNVSSRNKVEKTYIKEDNLTEGKDRANYISETKLNAGLNNIGRMTKESNTRQELHGWRKNDARMNDNYEYETEHKRSRDAVNRDRYAEINKSKSERKIKKKDQNGGDDENPGECYNEKKHDKDRDDREKRKKWLSNDSEKVAEKKHHKDSAGKDRHAEGGGAYEREIKRKYRNGDVDKTQDRNASRKQDLGKHHHMGMYERKERRERVKSHYEESTAKRRRSRSREREDRRRRSPSFSPKARKHTYHDGERKESSMLSLKDSSRKMHSDNDRSRVSTNGSSSHHHRHGGSTSGLGGYSPRKRKSEAGVKTPSPSKYSLEKKRAGWDLPPVGTDNPSPAVVSSNFQLSNHTVILNTHDVAAATSVDPDIVKSLPGSFLNDVLTGKNANIDSVQLTQATRPMRRLYLENLPDSASEKAVMDCFNNLLLSSGVNHIQQAQPCISCILHKDKGQALVEFLTAEDASAALSFDGSTLFGSIVKIRRPKDYIEVSTVERERSADTVVAISDVVIDSPDKIFVGGISNHLSSEMLMEIAGAFGSLKAYHFETEDTKGSHAFLEYVDHSVTVKACAGLNGLTLAGEVLTVVQAMPDASSLENGERPPSYGIPEHAKPLLRKPTQVLKIKDVFTVESLSSLSDMAIEEVLEDVRLECARFGTIKSLNVVKHGSDKNVATKLEECEVISNVDSKEASQDSVHDNSNAESSFSGKSTYPKSKATSVGFHYKNELEEDNVENRSGVNVDKLADEDFDNKSCQEEQIVTDTTVEDIGNKSILSGIIQECPDCHDTCKDGSELLDKMVANDIGTDIENRMAGGNADSDYAVCKFQQGFSELDVSSGTELVDLNKGIDKEDDICDHVFEPGSILVEYGRTEACCSAAHCLHGRFFDGRMVTVEYVPLSLCRERFTK